MTDPAAKHLSDFQLEIAAVFFGLPESVGFLLAGGGALIAQGIIDRETDDLDFFATRASGDVEAASDALSLAVERRGWMVKVIRSGPDYRRLKISRVDAGAGDAEAHVYVDLAIDTPTAGVPTITIAGPSFPASDLAVRKTLALFSRAEPRDFTDLYALHQSFDRDDLLREAALADDGFDLPVFVQMLRSHRRLSAEDFPTTVAVIDVRAYFDAWAEEIEQRDS